MGKRGDRIEGRKEGRGRKRYTGVGGDERGGLDVALWNVADLVNKDKEFWEGLKDWDVMVLSETWVEVEGWRRVREKVTGGVYLEVASGLEKTRKRKDEEEGNNDK